MTDSSSSGSSSGAAARRHVVFMPRCGASPLMSNCPWSSRPQKKETSFWLSRYQLPNLRRNMEWGRRSWGGRAEMNLLRLIQEGQVSAGKTCLWRRRRRRRRRKGGILDARTGGDARCLYIWVSVWRDVLYSALWGSEREREREREGGMERQSERVRKGGGRRWGAEKEVHIIDFWEGTFLLTSSGADI